MTKLILQVFLFLSISAFAQTKTTAINDTEFLRFLENSLTLDVNNKNRNDFFKKSSNYWENRKLDYNLYPEKYEKAISLFHKNQEKYKSKKNPKNDKSNSRIENAVKNFQNLDDKNTFAKNSILFVGSSSIAGWKTSISFPEFSIINRGIGGMNMTEIIRYYDTLIKKHAPSVIAIYCDIDIEQGKSPETAVNAFKELTRKIKADFPKTPILLLSMKPAMVDDFIGRDIRKNKMITNQLLLKLSKSENNVQFVDLASPMLNTDGTLKTDIFIEDGMHLNKLGYEIWNPIIKNILLELTK